MIQSKADMKIETECGVVVRVVDHEWEHLSSDPPSHEVHKVMFEQSFS